MAAPYPHVINVDQSRLYMVVGMRYLASCVKTLLCRDERSRVKIQTIKKGSVKPGDDKLKQKRPLRRTHTSRKNLHDRRTFFLTGEDKQNEIL